MTQPEQDRPGTDSNDVGDSANDADAATTADATAATTTVTTPTVSTHRRTLILFAIAFALVAVDIVSKIIIVATVQPGENVRVLGGLVYFTQIRNGGAAFNMATGMTWLLAVIALGVVVFIIKMAPKLKSTPWAVCLGLILGGAVGNLLDRIFRAPGVMQGHVVDFVSVFGPNAEHFPAFNAADSGISIGGVLLVVLAVLGYDYDGTRHHKSSDGDRG
ncbi:MAG: signal peptidase II [Nakamurella sp.]